MLRGSTTLRGEGRGARGVVDICVYNWERGRSGDASRRLPCRMGIVLSIVAISEAIAAAVAAASAAAATIAEGAALAISLALPALDVTGLSSLADLALDTAAEGAIDEAASNG